MTISDILLWYNIGYVGSFILGLIFLVTAIFGAETGDGSAEHDLDHDIDHDVEHDIGHDADYDADHDVEHDVSDSKEYETAGGSSGSVTQSFMSLLGVGRCPFSIILMSFFFLCTFLGFSMNIILKQILIATPIFGLINYVLSMILSIFLTGRLARVVGKLMPGCETYVRKEYSLVGRLGKSIYAFTDNRGYVQVYDDTKTLKEISANNIEPTRSIRAGDDVLIVDYDSKERVFQVRLAPDELTRSSNP